MKSSMKTLDTFYTEMVIILSNAKKLKNLVPIAKAQFGAKIRVKTLAKTRAKP